MSEDVKIGVYVCHCGVNISHTVDVAACREFAEKAPGVAVARDYKFMCSNTGQELIQSDIEELKLTRVVVAACSPLMHEGTFRGACQGVGLNQYLFQMSNIREQCAWVHDDRKLATLKAMALINAAIHRVALQQPLEPMRAKVNPASLIVGAGIAGIQAALELAESGNPVYLVEREPSVGGKMAMFDKTFPTQDCSACLLTPKMVSGSRRQHLKLRSSHEVVGVSGYIGNYKIRVRRKARYVDPSKCTGCGQCWSHCPSVRIPTRRAIRLPDKLVGEKIGVGAASGNGNGRAKGKGDGEAKDQG